MPTVYNAKQFEEAHERFIIEPKALTDDDLAQLTLIDARLGERARARRAGFVDAEDATEDAATNRKTAMTVQAFHEFQRDWFEPILSTYRYKNQELQTRLKALEDGTRRIDALEARVLELEAQAAAARTVDHVDR